MANSETKTNTNNTLEGEFQVFLSFRGPDTRHGFTKSLYHALDDAGIRVFIDDEELRLGERISGNLERAIDDSQLYIPIFSKNYASSHWCLRELAKMVENNSKSKDGKKKVILPIFYDVKPDDVKLETPLYSEAIFNLKRKMEDQKKDVMDVKMWQEALKKVVHTGGWELDKYSSSGDLIKLVVNKVVVMLKTRQRHVTKDLVGMEDRIADIHNLLDIDFGGVRVIGICGMGGIGKTTLAKIIFNQLCPHFGKNCSFLDDVREKAKTKGLDKLQKQLMSDISRSRGACDIYNMDQGINMIRETIYNEKMLIVLDDVDEGSQIQQLIGVNSLYPGTRILITTRDESVLEKIKGFVYEILHYKMKWLNKKDALELFSRHAFNDSSPPVDYYTLSKDIVSTTGGLPLALVAIGSSLRCEEKAKWEEWLGKLKKTPHRDVLGKLRISYDALEEDQQQIFLDVACFFVGEDKTNPMYVWKDCEYKVEYDIEVLTKRFMLKVLDDGKFWMHDQFRDFGRAIVNQEDLRYPGRRTRLWVREDIIRELKSIETKENVRALRLTSSLGWPERPIIVTSEQIKRFPRLWFLWLYGLTCQGDFTGCFSELKWIDLQYSYSIPAGPAAGLPRPSASRQWFEATYSLDLEDVVVVNLSGLDLTEDVFESLIKGARKLKVLTLAYNTLIHGTPTFPEYSVLEKLTISDFLSLKEIDCSIGKLRSLIELSFDTCVELQKLPKQIGRLRNLQHLSLRGCDSLSELPDSVLKLKSLTKLDVSCTRITRLPDNIGELPSLLSVDLSFTPIAKLPRTMSEFRELQTLRLNHCDQMRELPKLPKSLTTLRLSSTSLLTVPNLSDLANLVELALSDGSESMARSDTIQTCDLQWIGSLSKLSKLYFCFSNVCAPTIELGSLSLLEELTLHGVDVPSFKQLPSNLIVLQLYDTRGKQLCHERIPPLEKETAIVSSSSIESREKKVLRQLELRFIGSHEPSESEVRLREEPECNELQAPELIDHWRGAFLFPSSLKMLQKFVLWGCPEVHDIQFVSTLELLFVFSVGGCTSLKSIGGLSYLKHLMELTLNRCPSLQVVEGIDELEFLRKLKIDGCRSMEMIFDASSSKIPDKCEIQITCSGELRDSRPASRIVTWNSYMQRPDSETETTDYESETEDPQQKANQENEEEETESAKRPLNIVAQVRFPENFLENDREKELKKKSGITFRERWIEQENPELNRD